MHHILRAAFWMSGTILAFTAMAVAGRKVSLDLDTFEIMLYRSFFGLLIVLAMARWAGTTAQIRPRFLHWHALRNLFHFTGQNLWFYALTVIPLAQVFALEFTSPLWIMLISPLILGEKLTSNRILAALAGFVGVLIVTRPDVDSFHIGQVAAAVAAIGFAGSAVFTRKLTQFEPITQIMFWLTAMQALLGLICAGIDGQIALPTAANLPWLLAIAGLGLSAHFCLTRALGLAPVTVVMPMDFIRLPVAALVGMAVYSELLDPMIFLGGAVIFAANYLNVLYETRRPGDV